MKNLIGMLIVFLFVGAAIFIGVAIKENHARDASQRQIQFERSVSNLEEKILELQESSRRLYELNEELKRTNNQLEKTIEDFENHE